ncbi:PAS domain S-box protein [Chloroflexia bacterium SDU3-3]|nr:PAS domain S-box protein [Chloroflexia bacterium SDU3-3]
MGNNHRSERTRDAAALAPLVRYARPLIAQKYDDARVRVWVVGCGTGEPAYTVAIQLHELLAQGHTRLSLQIFATDTSQEAIATARQGMYSQSSASQIAPDHPDAFFTLSGQRYRISPSIRDTLVFSRHNPLSDPPFPRLDMIVVLDAPGLEAQDSYERLLAAFHFALQGQGLLAIENCALDTASSPLFALRGQEHGLRIYTACAVSASAHAHPLAGGGAQRAESEAAVGGAAPPHIRTVPELTYADMRATIATLTAVQEEYQAFNEELITYNSELQYRVDDLTQINTDLQNLLFASNIGTLFLNARLQVIGATPSVRSVFQLDEASTPQPIVQVEHRLDYPQLLGDLQSVIDSGQGIEREVADDQGYWYLVRVQPYHGQGPQASGVVLSYIDISERRQHQQALAQERSTLASILESISDAYASIDKGWRCRYVNQAAERLLGIDRSDMLGQDIRVVLARTELAPYLASVQQVMQDRNMIVFEGRYPSTDTWVDVRVYPMDDGGMTIYQRDITERKQAELLRQRSSQELEQRVAVRTAALDAANRSLQAEARAREHLEQVRRELLRGVVSAQEQERKRLSHELHDQLGQEITALMLGLQALKDRSYGRGATLGQIEQLLMLCDDLSQEVHQMALDLRPPALDDLGLVATLTNYIERWGSRSGIAVDLHSDLGKARLPADMEVTIFRVVQEALTNVMRYAGATHVGLLIELRGDGQLLVIIEDNGIGFDADAILENPKKTGRLGLLGMSERVAQIGGTLTIESTSGSGTTIFVQVPLESIPSGPE